MRMIIYEGTTEEIERLTREQVKEAKEETANESVQRPFYKKGRRWTAEEDNILCSEKSIDDMMKKLPHRTRQAIFCRRVVLNASNNSMIQYRRPKRYTEQEKRLMEDTTIPSDKVAQIIGRSKNCVAVYRATHKIKAERKKIYKRTSPTTWNKNRDRLYYVNNKARAYIIQYGWTWEKAFRQASQEYQTHKGIGKVTTEMPVKTDKKPMYKAFKWNTYGNDTIILGIYATYDEAQNIVDEEKVKDKTLQESYQYAILKV